MFLAALRAHAFLASNLKIEDPLDASRRADGPLEPHDGGSGTLDAAERPVLPLYRDHFTLVRRAISSDQCLLGSTTTGKLNDHELGMDRPITRRDFLNGVSIAVTGSLLGPSSLVRCSSGEPTRLLGRGCGGVTTAPSR
jgi:hypothetical protein